MTARPLASATRISAAHRHRAVLPRKATARYYLKMASVIGKRQNGRTYYYLAESARVEGRPRIVSQRYLGSADDIEAAFDGAGSAPERSRHLSFGDVAAAWQVLTELGVAQTVDDIVATRRAKVSVGRYLALAVLHRIVTTEAPPDLAAWWPTTAAARFVRPRLELAALSHRRFWRAMHRLTSEHIDQIQAALVARVLGELGSDVPALVVDVPDFATFVDAAEPVPARDGAGSEAGARLAGLALVATLDGAVPLVSQVYQHEHPDAASFTTLAGRLTRRYRSLSGAGSVTVVIGAGQHAQADLGARMGLHFVGPLPPGDHPRLVRGRAGGWDATVEGLPDVTAVDSRTRVSGTDRRVVLTHSKNVHEAQARGLARNLGHATRRLDELAMALHTAVHRPSRDEAAAEIARITSFPWGNRVLRTDLTGAEPGDLTLRWWIDESARSRLHRDLFGRQLLVTDHDDWSVAQVITAYRARHRLDTTLKQLADPVVSAPSVNWRWDPHRIAVHGLICALATTVVHLMRRRAQQAGLNLSVRDLLDRLAGIEETVLRYPSTGGRPRTRRLLTDRDETQQRLYDLFRLHEHAPRS